MIYGTGVLVWRRLYHETAELQVHGMLLRVN
jgi:hypothetical protein